MAKDKKKTKLSIQPCPHCNGQGWTRPANQPTVTCPECHGTGLVEMETDTDAATL